MRRRGDRDLDLDLESQAFIEPCFGQFNKRYASRSEWEAIDQARREIGPRRDLCQCLP
jgi:hypothetical protein